MKSSLLALSWRIKNWYKEPADLTSWSLRSLCQGSTSGAPTVGVCGHNIVERVVPWLGIDIGSSNRGSIDRPDAGSSIVGCGSFDRPDCGWFDCPVCGGIRRKEDKTLLLSITVRNVGEPLWWMFMLTFM